MKLVKLVNFLTQHTKAESLMFRIIDDQLVVSASDGVTNATAVIPAADVVGSWAHDGAVTVTALDFNRAFRDDAILSVDGSVLTMTMGRWRVGLPCDLLENSSDTAVTKLKGEGMVPPPLLNVNTTDAFGSDVWVSFITGPRDPIIAITSAYAGTILYGQTITVDGSFPAKLLPAIKVLTNNVVRTGKGLVSVTGNYQLSATLSVEVTVTTGLPHASAPPIDDVQRLAANITGNAVQCSALELRKVIEAVTKLLPEEAKNLRLKYSKSKTPGKAGSLNVSLQTDTAQFSEAIRADTKEQGELLLPTKMFTLSLAGLTLTLDTYALITHLNHQIKVDIVEPVATKGKKSKTAEGLIATILMREADDESDE